MVKYDCNGWKGSMKPFVRLWITEHHLNSIFGLFLVPTVLIFHPVLGYNGQYNWHKELKSMGCSVGSQLTSWRSICTNSKSTIAANSFLYGFWSYGSRKVIFSELAFMPVWFLPWRCSSWARARGAEYLYCLLKHLEHAFHLSWQCRKRTLHFNLQVVRP